jgi:hypothetical protein
MNTYTQFQAMAATRKRSLANNTRLIVRDDGGYGIELHSTQVVIHYPDRVVLNSGGWQTVTTKDRMGRYSPFNVYSEKAVWYVRANGESYPFADGITIYNDGRVTGAGPDPHKTIRLRKQVNAFSKAYADAFCAGKVTAPSAGDCWGCLMVATDGTAPMGGADHVLEHIKQSYFVPSILNRMADAGTLSIMDKDYIARKWQNMETSEWQRGMAHERIRKTVRKFCFRELGLAS